MFYPIVLNCVSFPFAPFFLHLFFFSPTFPFFHLSLIAVLIHLNQQPHSPDQTVALTTRGANRPEEIGWFLSYFVPSTATFCKVLNKLTVKVTQWCYRFCLQLNCSLLKNGNKGPVRGGVGGVVRWSGLGCRSQNVCGWQTHLLYCTTK